MALDRWKLREDLVAMIAAGRELSPEHDYALADVFLHHAHDHLLIELMPPPPPAKRSHVAAWIGAGTLVLGALLSPFLFGHDHDYGRPYDRTVVQGPYDAPGHGDGSGWWGQDWPHNP